MPEISTNSNEGLALVEQELRWLEEFMHRSRSMNRLLEDYDLHKIRTQAEITEFWEQFALEGAELVQAFSAVARLRGGSGRERILKYLQDHVGEVVEGLVLYAVSGISEYGRRVRELRERGWRISTHENDRSLKPGQYRLEAGEPDPRIAFAFEEKQRQKRQRSKPAKQAETDTS